MARNGLLSAEVPAKHVHLVHAVALWLRVVYINVISVGTNV